MNDINTLDKILVVDAMARKGVEHYTMRKGNGCVWVSWGRVDCYFVIRDGKIVDEIYD